jgi:hypothetical protein
MLWQQKCARLNWKLKNSDDTICAAPIRCVMSYENIIRTKPARISRKYKHIKFRKTMAPVRWAITSSRTIPGVAEQLFKNLLPGDSPCRDCPPNHFSAQKRCSSSIKILVILVRFQRKCFSKYPQYKVHENPFSCSRVVDLLRADGQTPRS